MTQSKFKDNSGPNGKDSCLLDTNIVLGFLQQQPNLMKLFQLELSGRPYLVREITRIELLGYPNLTQTEETVIEKFLSFVEILPIHHQIANRVIQLRRLTTRLKLPDTIAATAIEHQLILVSCEKIFSTLSFPWLSVLNPDEI